MASKPTLVTAALPYANGPVHIGHLAGCYIPADVYVRYLRLKGDDVKFVCGSDEHGVPITLKAKAEGITPQQVVDKYHLMMKKSFEDFGISFDIYSRTSNKIHHETASEFFKTLYEKGKFTEQVTQQYYDEEAKQFLADRYIEGTCPNCGNEKAYGDQCENCGSSLSPSDLINPKSKLSGNSPVLRETKHWFLPLNDYAPWLREYILEGHKHDWKPNVYGQCKSWLDTGDGLQPRAMTRDLDWGVKVPIEGSTGKVLYVWFDAPIGYISATKELLPDSWENYWKNPEARLIHFIGKDNIVFHCIIFPAILKAHGDYIVPENVPANEFLNLEGDKISTSRNWAVWLHEYLNDFPGKQDVLRYTLIATAPETKDNDFTWKDFQARNNNELVAILGNFINRTLVLTGNYFEGKVPAANDLSAADTELIEFLKSSQKQICDSIEKYRLREALAIMMDVARAGNKYLADNEPWKLIKTDENRTATVLKIALEVAAHLTVIMEPFLPHTTTKLRKMLNIETLGWGKSVAGSNLKTGHQLGQAELLFDKIEDEAITAQMNRLENIKNEKKVEAQNSESAEKAEQASTIAPQKAPTSFDDFTKMDIRVGTILEAERVPKTDKLLKLLIDTGIDRRTVVSGIAADFKPEDIIGQQVTILANLEPRKIKGIESQGMILMTEDKDGKLVFVTPSRPVDNGGTVR
ncbi:MAG: methionine--tRNA ligase [Bacteroidetes bacterium]|nr:methionine--tRNA ligase [Bacteroidota bacterium]